MKRKIEMPWASWEKPETRVFEFPEEWEITEARMQNTEEISTNDIKQAINNPVDALTLSELAKGKKTVVIVIDDMTRPTPVSEVIPFVLEELHESGIKKEDITIIGAVGSHRPLQRKDYLLKLGKRVVDEYNIENHHPYENLVDLGKTKTGTPIHVNKTYYEADLKIAISGVIPHPLAGYGGGAKIILPGICGIETLFGNHNYGMKFGRGVGIGRVTTIREDIEDTAKNVGLDFSINIIFTEKGRIGGIFAGDYIEAHRKAMKLGDKVYNTEITLDNDVIFFNVFPEDTELNQATKAFNFLMTAPQKILQKRGIIVIMTNSIEGRGYHSLIFERGSKLYTPVKEQIIWIGLVRHRKVYLFSENISKPDADFIYGKDAVLLFNNWEELINKINEEYDGNPKVMVIPTSIQFYQRDVN